MLGFKYTVILVHLTHKCTKITQKRAVIKEHQVITRKIEVS